VFDIHQMAVKRSSPNCGRPPSVVLNDDTSEESSITTPWNLKKLVFEDQQKPTSRRRIFKSQSKLISNIPWDLVIAVPTWYLIGVGSICTTKMLLMNEYSLPPLVLTFQQLLIGSTLLHLHLTITGGLQPLPKNNTELSQPSIYFDFVLAGLFNALDFLASNTSFSHSSASFVETIKASEPLTTTSIALFFGIDTLSGIEALSILVLISGVFFSTMANAGDGSAGKMEMNQSIKTCLVVMTANLCFGFRAKSQKLFRAHADGKRLDDANLLMRMEQIGAISMLLPVLIFELPGILERGVNASFEKHCHYWALAVVNAACFCTYW
jgi:drug/metabolite transporter (DMT)-like permease